MPKWRLGTKHNIIQNQRLPPKSLQSSDQCRRHGGLFKCLYILRLKEMCSKVRINQVRDNSTASQYNKDNFLIRAEIEFTLELWLHNTARMGLLRISLLIKRFKWR